MFIQYNDTVQINDLVLSFEDFKVLEPTIEPLPTGYQYLIYTPGKEHEIGGAGRNIIKRSLNWDEGNRYIERYEEFKFYKNKLNEENSTFLVDQELKNRMPYKEARCQEYPLIDDLVIALWEHIVENKSLDESNINKLQQLRQSIKNRYSKGS